jgi:hypothetical protein
MAKVVRSENASGKNWYHLSLRGDTKILRQLTTDGLITCKAMPLLWDIELSKSQIVQLVKKFPKVNEKDDWIKLLTILERGDYPSKLTANNGSIFVPRTRLRTYRFAFRDWTMGLKRAQASFFVDNIECLQELWNLSVKEIEKYNYQEKFHERMEVESPTESRKLSQIQNTVDAAAYFQSRYATSQVLANTEFRYLDREIAPLRTRDAQFVGGGAATSSGAGGMDLLLLAGKRVCAGEVKVGNDSELFEALLQGMWYGSELATKKQIKRVAKFYSLEDLKETLVDVAVFSINQKNDPTREATIKLADKINTEGRFGNLGRVYLIENVGDEWRTIE